MITVCGWAIPYPGGFDQRKPDCDECLAVLESRPCGTRKERDHG